MLNTANQRAEEARATMVSVIAEPQAGRLEAVVRAELASVYRLLRHLGVSVNDADDAVQQVFLVFSRRLDAVEPGREQAFLRATTVRIASRWRRTLRRRREDLGVEQLSSCEAPQFSPEAELERTQAQELLLNVLDAMAEELRPIFVLFEIEELSMREISEALELPAGTVASRLRRAREQFQRSVASLRFTWSRGVP